MFVRQAAVSGGELVAPGGAESRLGRDGHGPPAAGESTDLQPDGPTDGGRHSSWGDADRGRVRGGDSDSVREGNYFRGLTAMGYPNIQGLSSLSI